MTRVHTFECVECGSTEHVVSGKPAASMNRVCPRCGHRMDAVGRL